MNKKTAKFDGLSEKMNANYEVEPEDNIDIIEKAENELDVINDKKLALIEKSKSIEFEDKKYIKNELCTLISNTMEVMDILKEDLRQGTKASSFEAYAKLSGAVKDQIQELRELNKNIADIKLSERRIDLRNENPDIQQTITNNVIMTGSEMMDILLNVRENSKNKKIKDIDCEIEN